MYVKSGYYVRFQTNEWVRKMTNMQFATQFELFAPKLIIIIIYGTFN